MTVGVGDRQQLVFPIFTYTDPINTVAICGPIEYELVNPNPALGADPYIAVDSDTRTLTYYPKSNIYIGT